MTFTPLVALATAVPVEGTVSASGGASARGEYQSTAAVRILPREAKLLYADADDTRLRLYDAFVTAETATSWIFWLLIGWLAATRAPRPTRTPDTLSSSRPDIRKAGSHGP